MLPPSLLVISRGWGLIDLPLRATFSSTHPLANIFHPPYPPIASQSISRGRASSQGEGLPMLFISLRGSGQGRPLLRASNEHRFIVRVVRARRAPGRSLPILLRPRVARAQKIIGLHPLRCFASRRTTRLPGPLFFGKSDRRTNMKAQGTSSVLDCTYK